MSVAIHDLIDLSLNNADLNTLYTLQHSIEEKIVLKRKAQEMDLDSVEDNNRLTIPKHDTIIIFDPSGNEICNELCMTDKELNKDAIVKYLDQHQVELSHYANRDVKMKALGPLVSYLKRFLAFDHKNDVYILKKYGKEANDQYFDISVGQIDKLIPKKLEPLVRSNDYKDVVMTDPQQYVFNMMSDKINYHSLLQNPITLNEIYHDYLERGYSASSKPKDIKKVIYTELIGTFTQRRENEKRPYKYTFDPYQETFKKWCEQSKIKNMF